MAFVELFCICHYPPTPDKTASFLKNTSLWNGAVSWRALFFSFRLSSYWWLDLVLLGSVNRAPSWPGSESHTCLLSAWGQRCCCFGRHGASYWSYHAPREHDYICSTPSKHRAHLLAAGASACLSLCPGSSVLIAMDEETLLFIGWHRDSEDGSIWKMFAQQA